MQIWDKRVKPQVLDALQEQGLPAELAGLTVTVTNVGEFGSTFLAPGCDLDWHVFFERAPRIYNMATVKQPVETATVNSYWMKGVAL